MVAKRARKRQRKRQREILRRQSELTLCEKSHKFTRYKPQRVSLASHTSAREQNENASEWYEGGKKEGEMVQG